MIQHPLGGLLRKAMHVEAIAIGGASSIALAACGGQGDDRLGERVSMTSNSAAERQPVTMVGF